MQPFFRPLFLSCCFLFILHQLLQKVFGISIPLADAYLDNLLIMPLVLTAWLAEKRGLFKAGPQYQLSKVEIIMATIYILLTTEWLFPLLTSRFTYDPVDIAITAAGSITYYFTTQKRELQKIQN